MTDADPAFWSGHAPLLFPIVGGLNGGSYRLDGREYELARHGFARRMEWEVVGVRSDAVTFRLTDTPETRTVYPFAFAIAVLFALEGTRLSIVVRIENPADQLLPFSFGFHPAFAWPLPGGGEKLAHEIVFAEEERAPIRRLDADGLVAFSESSPVSDRRLPLRHEDYAADALIWDELASRACTYRGENGVALEIAFPDTPYLGVWQKPGANFICIEPWAGIADDAGFAGDFRDKRGVMSLIPGEERSFRVDVTVLGGS